MIIRVKNNINFLAGNPKVLFLIDSLGAMLTAFFLLLILRNFNEYFGMPETILTYLAGKTACFCVYSICCFFFLTNYWSSFIYGIVVANLLYCVVTMALLIIYNAQLTIIGTIYFLLEIAIILGIVYLEFNVAKTIKKSRTAGRY